MTGDDNVEPSFDDPSHDAIRALLRDARAEEPVPADVVARLDATLAELRGQAPVTDEPLAEVVALRRRVVRLRPLVAAAAVIVVAVGGGGLAVSLANRTTHGPPTSAASASKATSESGALTTPTAPGLRPLTSSPGTLGNPNDLATQRVTAFTTAGFARQAAAFVSTNATYATAGGAAASSGSGSAGTGSGTAASGVPAPPSPYPAAAAPPAATPKSAATCVTPIVAAAELVPITLDGQPATLVLHPVSGGSQLVEAWSCDGTHVLAHTSVPG